MRISKEEEGPLETWLFYSLEKAHERNPDSLSKYIISLLKQQPAGEEVGNNSNNKKENNMEKLKGFCQEELKTFLKEKTIPFVDNLFEALQGKRNPVISC